MGMYFWLVKSCSTPSLRYAIISTITVTTNPTRNKTISEVRNEGTKCVCNPTFFLPFFLALSISFTPFSIPPSSHSTAGFFSWSDFDHIINAKDGDSGFSGVTQRFHLGHGRLQHTSLEVVSYLSRTEKKKRNVDKTREEGSLMYKVISMQTTSVLVKENNGMFIFPD